MAVRKKKYSRKKWRWFILNDQLHKTLGVNLPAGEVIAWNYPEHKKVIYSIESVKRYGCPALRASAAGKILNRKPQTLRTYTMKGIFINKHQSYNIETGRPGFYYYSKDDLLKALEAISQIHRGRPRKDGGLTNRTTPTPGEVRAATHYDMHLYTKTDDGRVIRVWEADKTEW